MSDLEAQRIYRAIFRRPAPEIIAERFREISARLDEKASREEMEAYARAIQRTSDLEALELAGRFTKRLPLLSLKFRSMVYLAETLPENQRFYVNQRTHRVGAVFSIAICVLGSAFKMCKGLYLLARLKHA